MNKLIKILLIVLPLLTIQAQAWIVDFNEEKYSSLTTRYDLSASYTQQTYLQEFIHWTHTGQLALPDDDTISYSWSNLSTFSPVAMTSIILELENYLVKINTWFLIVDAMEQYMNLAGCTQWDNCTRDSAWGLWFLQECLEGIDLDNVDPQFTNDWDGKSWGVYCSNAKFNKQSTQTKIDLLKKQALIIDTLTKLRIELQSRTIILQEDRSECNEESLWKLRLNAERWNRPDICSWNPDLWIWDWIPIRTWPELCRFDDSYFDNCMFWW